MAKELMEIGGFITSGAEIVNHDNSLSGNGTVESPLSVVPGYNETVLWENSNKTSTRLISWPQQLTESINNFEYVSIYYNGDGTSEFAPRIHNFSTSGNGFYNLFDIYNPPNTNNLFYRLCKISLNGTAMNVEDNFTYNFPNGDNNHTGYNVIYKVVGINRVANN